jgi:hypothetical protein
MQKYALLLAYDVSLEFCEAISCLASRELTILFVLYEDSCSRSDLDGDRDISADDQEAESLRSVRMHNQQF